MREAGGGRQGEGVETDGIGRERGGKKKKRNPTRGGAKRPFSSHLGTKTIIPGASYSQAKQMTGIIPGR